MPACCSGPLGSNSPSPSVSPSPSPSATACPPAPFPTSLYPLGAVTTTLTSFDGGAAPVALAGSPAAPGKLLVAVASAAQIFSVDMVTGVNTLLAGGPWTSSAPIPNTQVNAPCCWNDGTGTDAVFGSPVGLAATAGGMLYVTDQLNSLIRSVVVATGATQTLAGKRQYVSSGSGPFAAGAWTGVVGYANGVGSNAIFNKPTGIATDGANLYVADGGSNNIIRAISLATTGVRTLLGGGLTGNNNIGVAAFGCADGAGTNALFRTARSFTGDIASAGVTGLAADAAADKLYVLDMNGIVRVVSSASANFPTTATLMGACLNGTANTARYGGAYAGASLQVNAYGNAAAGGVAVGLSLASGGRLLIADGFNIVRFVNASSGSAEVLAGGGGGCGTLAGYADAAALISGAATSVLFANPSGVWYDAPSGATFVADAGNAVVRAIRIPSVSPSATSSSTPSVTVSPSASRSTSVSPSLSFSATWSSTVSGSLSPSSTVSPSVSSSASLTPSASATASPSASPSVSGSVTASSSVSASASVTATASPSSSLSGSVSWSSSVSGSLTPSVSASSSPSLSSSVSASVTLSSSVSWSSTVSSSLTPSVSPSRSASSSISSSVTVTRSTTISSSVSASVTATTSISVSATPTPVTGYVQVALTLYAPVPVGGGRPARALQSLTPADYSATNLLYAVLALKCDLASITGVSAARISVTSAVAAAAGVSASGLGMAQRNATLAGPALCAQLVAALPPAANPSALPPSGASVALLSLTYQVAPSFLDAVALNVTGDTSLSLVAVSARIAAAAASQAAYSLATSVWNAINGGGSWPVSTFLAAAAPTTWGYAYGAVPQSGALNTSQQVGLGVGIGVTLGVIALVALLMLIWWTMAGARAASSSAAAAAGGGKHLFVADPAASAFAAAIAPAAAQSSA